MLLITYSHLVLLLDVLTVYFVSFTQELEVPVLENREGERPTGYD